MDEQVLMGVLLCLPPTAIYRFRVVSKSWNELISHPFFIERYDGRRRQRGGQRLLALFQRTKFRTKILYVDLPRNRKTRRRSLNLQDCKFINSSDGLILCSNSDRHPKEYYVLNLITPKFVQFPSPVWRGCTTIGLMCEENKYELAPKYIVVRIACDSWVRFTDILRIETYSSESGVWTFQPRIGIPGAQSTPCVISSNPLVINGVFHWYNHCNFQFIYVPYDLPSRGRESSAFTRSSIEEGDMLWFSTMDSRTALAVFMLPKCVEDGANNKIRPTIITWKEWVLAYHISVDSIWNDIILLSPKAMRKALKSQWKIISERNIFLDAFVPAKKEEKSYLALILRVAGDVYLYNLDPKSIECIQYSGGLVTKNEDEYDKSSLTLCPYLEPSSLSVYALN